MALNKEQILALGVRKHGEAHGIRLQSLNELELSSLESLWGKRYEESTEVDLVMRRELLAFAIVDDNGNRLFKLDEVDVLGQLPAGVIADCYLEARRLSGMDSRAQEVEQLEKKSPETVV